MEDGGPVFASRSLDPWSVVTGLLGPEPGPQEFRLVAVYIALANRITRADPGATGVAYPLDSLARDVGQRKALVHQAVLALARSGCVQVEEEPVLLRNGARGIRYLYALSDPASPQGTPEGASSSAPAVPRGTDVLFLSSSHCMDAESKHSGSAGNDEDSAALVRRLLDLGIEIRIAEHLARTRPAADLELWMQALKDQGRLRNPAGWLIAALTRGWTVPWRTTQRLAAESRAAQRAAREAQARREEAAHAAQVAEERESVLAAERAFAALDTATRARITAEVEAVIRHEQGYPPTCPVPHVLVLMRWADEATMNRSA